MCKEKKQKKSKVIPIINTILTMILIFLLIYSAYNYGRFIGQLEGNYQALGIDGICNKLNDTMVNNRCELNQPTTETNYINHFDCVWGDFSLYSERKPDLPSKLYVRIMAQCKHTYTGDLHK